MKIAPTYINNFISINQIDLNDKNVLIELFGDHMKFILTLISITILSTSNLYADKDCKSRNRVPICHVGAGAHPHNKTTFVCSDFGSLRGHFVEHPKDTVGECGVDLEANLKVWACNAGLRHRDHTDGLCFDLNNGGNQVPNCSGLSNCLCSGDALPQILNNFDYFTFEKANYYQGQILSPYMSGSLEAGRIGFEQASSTQGSEILNNETGVSFYLGSERFGSDYFVDLCWELLNERLYNEPMNIQVDMRVTTDTFNSGESYLNTSEVTQRSGIFCDYTSTAGQYVYETSPSFTTSELPFYSGERSFSTTRSGARSCFTRLMFSEKQNELLRPWDLKKVTVQTDLNVEPVNDIDSIDLGLRFCHVYKVKPSDKNWICKQLDFPTSQDLREYLIIEKLEEQDHQKDYRGTCEATCGPLTGNEANSTVWN